MGAWSVRLMDDDGARDIIDEYKILMGYGVEEQNIMAQLSRQKFDIFIMN